jgi:CRISPR-associated protein Cas6
MTVRSAAGCVETSREDPPMAVAGASIVDVLFELAATTLPADHADALANAVARWLPWLETEPAAGIHPLRAAATSHGMVVLARRAKLVLRVPASRAADCRTLCGQALDVAGSAADVGAASERPLAPSATLYAHRVTIGTDDERAFHDAVARWLVETGVRCEFISGRPRRFTAGTREVVGFGLALHGLSPTDSIRVQGAGMGGDRRLGCGIFVPHKTIAIPA